MDDVQGFAFVDTDWCFENCWWLHNGTTYDRLSVATADSGVESPEPTVNFTYPGDNQAQSGTKAWIREFGLVIDTALDFSVESR